MSRALAVAEGKKKNKRYKKLALEIIDIIRTGMVRMLRSPGAFLTAFRHDYYFECRRRNKRRTMGFNSLGNAHARINNNIVRRSPSQSFEKPRDTYRILYFFFFYKRFVRVGGAGRGAGGRGFFCRRRRYISKRYSGAH